MGVIGKQFSAGMRLLFNIKEPVLRQLNLKCTDVGTHCSGFASLERLETVTNKRNNCLGPYMKNAERGGADTEVLPC